MPGETSLARQLEKLRAPQTSVFKEKKFKPSFLYDSQAAKSIDIDSHYAVALSGLDALSNVDENVRKYQHSLFKEDSKELERGLLTREENEDLDVEISSFLYEVVSQYLLFTGTHKLIEWLVVKYQVHEYNYNELVLSALPYHETKLFSRLVQLVPSEKLKKSDWAWLKGIQKHGVPLTKVDLLKHLKVNFSIFDGVSQVVFHRFDQISTTLVSFVTSVLVNVLNVTSSEEIVAVVLHYLHKAFRSSHKQVVLSGYLVLGALSCKTRLSEVSSEKLIKRMSKGFTKSKFRSEILNDYFLCVALVCQTQESRSLPVEALKAFDLNMLTMETAIRPKNYITGVVNLLVNECESNRNLKMLDEILKLVTQSDLILPKVLEAIIAKSRNDHSNDGSLSQIIGWLEKRFPGPFDKALRCTSYLDIKHLLVSPSYLELNNSLMSVSSALTHSSTEIKLSAILHIDETLVELNESMRAQLAESVASLMTNTDLEAKELTRLLECEHILKLVKKEPAFIHGCTHVAEYSLKMTETALQADQDWESVFMAVANVIPNLKYETNDKFFAGVIPLLFPATFISNVNVDVLDKMSSEMAKSNKLFNHLLSTGSQKNSATCIVNRCSVAANYCASEGDFELVKTLKSSKHFSHKLYAAIIFYMMSKSNSVTLDMFSDIFEVIQTLLENSKCLRVKKASATVESTIESNLALMLKETKVVDSLIHTLLEKMILGAFTNIKEDNDSWSWHKCDPLKSPLHSLFNLLCQYSSVPQWSTTFQSLLQIFTKKLKKSASVPFLSSFWVLNNHPVLQSRSLAIRFFMKDCPLVSIAEALSLLIACASPSASVRGLAGKVLDLYASEKNSLVFLKPSSKEIEEDFVSVSAALGKLYRDPRNHLVTHFVEKVVCEVSSDKTPEGIKCLLALLLSDCTDVLCVKAFVPFLHKLVQLNDMNQVQAKVADNMVSKLVYIIEKSRGHELNELLGALEVVLKTKYRSQCLVLMNPEWFNSASQMVQVSIVSSLLDLFLLSQDYNVESHLKELLQDGALVSELIDNLTLTSLTQNTQKPKRPKTVQRREFSAQEVEWKKVFLLLEIIFSRDQILNATPLMKSCLELLKETYVEEKASLDYFRRLLLSAIRACLLQDDCIRKMLDIQCILESFRFARQKETKREALLIINFVAREFRDQILDNVMLIFGYVGSNMVHCDDQYTLTVMDETLTEIIPAIVQGHNQVEEDIVEVFIDSIADIPAHRRLHIFRKLTDLLSEEKSLSFVLMKLCQRLITMSKKEQSELLEFGKLLSSSYDITVQLSTIAKLLTTAFEVQESPSSSLVGASLTDTQRRELVVITTTLTLNIVSGDSFLQSLRECAWVDVKKWFQELVSQLLVFIENVSVKEKKSRQDHYFRTLNRLLQNLLQKINEALPLENIISTVRSLLRSSNTGVQRKAMEILNAKLTQGHISDIKSSKFLKLLKPLCKVLPTTDVGKIDGSTMNAQIAMFSLKLLAKVLSEKEEAVPHFESTAHQLTGLLKTSSNYPESFLASGILCLSQVLSCMGTRAIPHIPPFIPLVLNFMSKDSQVVLLSCVTALAKTTQNFCQFLCTYLSEIFIWTARARCKVMDNPTAAAKLTIMKKNISSSVPIRTLIKALSEACSPLMSEDHEALIYLLSILNETLTAADTASLELVAKELENLFFTSLDYRKCVSNLAAVDAVEDKIIECVLVFIPKLSELTFRPFFYHLYDWAVHPKSDSSEKRIVTFYRLTNQLADRIRSLFCLFAAPYIVANCITQLELYNTIRNKDFESDDIAHAIVVNVLLTLSKSFFYDSDRTFTSKDKLDKLLPVIIDQINNEVGSAEMRQYRINECVAKCLQNIARTVEDTHIMKDLHYKLMLKTRENCPIVRYHALQVYQQLVLSLKSEYLTFVPEAVPFLAELHDDDNADVQKVLITVLKDLEEIVGEPIAKYF